jgi:hypothetical protein
MKMKIKIILQKLFFINKDFFLLFLSNKFLEKLGVKSKFINLVENKTKIPYETSNEYNKKFLFLRMRFMPRAFTTELMLAHSLRSKGVDCKFLLDSPILNISNSWDIRSEENNTVKLQSNIDYFNNQELSKVLNFTSMFIDDYITVDKQKEIESRVSISSVDDLRSFSVFGIDLKDELYLSLCKYLFVGNISEKEIDKAQDFAKASAVLVYIFKKVFSDEKPDAVVMNCGHIFWYGIAYNILKSLGIKIITYDETTISVLNLTWIFDSRNPCVDFKWESEWESYRQEEFKDSDKSKIKYIIDERKKHYLYNKRNKTISLNSKYDLSRYRLVFSLFTNVLWDATVVGKHPVYHEGLIAWVKHTIEIIEKFDDVALIIRIHPAEKDIFGLGSREKVMDELLKWRPQFKENIIIIDSSLNINTYDVVDASDSVLAYASNIGLEAVLMDKIVFVVGPAHFRNKSFTIDPRTPSEFEDLLIKFIENKFEFKSQKEIALKYAFHAFVKTQMILPYFVDKNPFIVSDLKINDFNDFVTDSKINKLTDWMLDQTGYYNKN